MTTGDADCVDVTWRPDGAELAFVSARHPRADVDLVRDVYAIRARRHGAAAGHRLAGATARCPAYDPTAGRSYVTAVPDLGPDGVDFVARQAVPCRVDAAGGALEPLLDPAAAPPRRRDAGDGPGRRRRAGRRAARGRGGAAAGAAGRRRRRRRWSTGSFTVRGFAAGGRRRRRRRRARPVRGRADRAHPGTPAAADRRSAPAGRDRPGAPDARADGDGARTAIRCTAGSPPRPGPGRTRCC